MNLLDAFKQYIRDAMPGGALNPEVTTQGVLDTAALGTAPVPILGDAIGLAADVRRLAKNPEERTPLNYTLAGLGALPFVPSGLGTIKKVASKAPQADALATAQKNAVTMLGLPPNNTAMDRAKALGYKDIGAHYTAADVERFRTGTRADNFAVWSTKDPSVNMAAHNIGRTGEFADGTQAMPLFGRLEARVPLTEKRTLGLSSDFPRTVTQQDARKASQAGYDHATIGTEIAIFDPSRIRSRFAAFDPARVNENDLLGRADLGMLGLLAGGSAGLAYARSDKDKKDKK